MVSTLTLVWPRFCRKKSVSKLLEAMRRVVLVDSRPPMSHAMMILASLAGNLCCSVVRNSCVRRTTIATSPIFDVSHTR